MSMSSRDVLGCGCRQQVAGAHAAQARPVRASVSVTELCCADDSDEESAAPPQPVAEAQTAKLEASQLPVNPRLRTRLFAAACLLELPGMVGEDPRHFDAVAAQKVSLVKARATCALSTCSGSSSARC